MIQRYQTMIHGYDDNDWQAEVVLLSDVLAQIPNIAEHPEMSLSEIYAVRIRNTERARLRAELGATK